MCTLDLFDETSLSLKLDSVIFRTKKNQNNTIRYGLHSVSEYFIEETLETGELLLKPGECVLACSNQSISMPLGYMGFVQTKGTLARMFVSAHCTDSQVEPGFSGKITLELMNFSPFEIIIPVGSAVAQLFITRCSTDNCNPYTGKYNQSEKPTIPLPFK
jgi:deoxycytidine triphosphate deaminase